MQKKLRFSIFLLLAAGCSDTPPAGTTRNALQPEAAALPPEQTVRGLYKSGKEVNTLYDCNSGKRYRVTDQTYALDSLYRLACEPAPCEDESVYAVVQGRIGPEDTMGHGTEYEGVLTISRIDTLTARTMFNTCLPFDFWCIGTEPFWGLLISEKDSGFFLKDVGEGRGKTFPWAAPKTDGKVWAYESTNPATKEKMKVVVHKGACSDGMSERIYNYSVDVTIGTQVLRGCAMRYGERLPRE